MSQQSKFHLLKKKDATQRKRKKVNMKRQTQKKELLMVYNEISRMAGQWSDTE